MINNSAKPIYTLVGMALVLGLAGDILFHGAAWGVNAAIGLALFLGSIAIVRRRHGLPLPRQAAWLMLPALGAACGFAWRDSPTLDALALVVLAASVLLGLRSCRAGQHWEQGILSSLGAALSAARDTLAGSRQFVRQDIPNALQSDPASVPKHGLAAGRGVLLSLPLLLVFGGLLSSADPVFGHYAAALFHWDFSTVWTHACWILLGFCLAGGCLHSLVQTIPDAALVDDSPPRVSAGRIETAIVLGALDILFLLFVLVQARYFFGGRETVLTTLGMTYAQYARHGFFELVTVSALTLPLLLTLHAWQPRRDAGPDPLFRALAGVMLLLLSVIMASALVRMNLYRSEYGLTELRVYTTAFMAWLALVFVWLAATVLRGQHRFFAAGAGASACLVIAALFLWNPDAQIVHANAALSHSGHRFDADYATSLSADAVPALLAALPSLSLVDQQDVASFLRDRWPATLAPDWRSWCWGRQSARHSLARSRARLASLAPSPPPVLTATPQVTTTELARTQTTVTRRDPPPAR